jgi:plasmid stability protein
MTITVDLPAETERKLRERAARAGQDVAALARELIQRGIEEKPTLDEILAPLRREFEASGMTDDELAGLVEELREEVWQEKQGRKAP